MTREWLVDVILDGLPSGPEQAAMLGPTVVTDAATGRTVVTSAVRAGDGDEALRIALHAAREAADRAGFAGTVTGRGRAFPVDPAERVEPRPWWRD